MNLDAQKLQQALIQYNQSLPQVAKWIGLIDMNGQFVCSLGDFQAVATELPPTNDDIAAQLHTLATCNYATLKNLNLQNYQSSIHMGHGGTLFLINLDDRFILGVSYHGLGDGCCFDELDTTEEAIREYSGIVMDAIYLD